ncbi:MAG TPA: hypothetical protein VEI97_17275 [bacterium]|nr:hypothetical protein [bacterium]
MRLVSLLALVALVLVALCVPAQAHYPGGYGYRAAFVAPIYAAPVVVAPIYQPLVIAAPVIQQVVQQPVVQQQVVQQQVQVAVPQVAAYASAIAAPVYGHHAASVAFLGVQNRVYHRQAVFVGHQHRQAVVVGGHRQAVVVRQPGIAIRAPGVRIFSR